MSFSKAEWEVLSSGNEDYYGLWEVSGGVRSPSVDIDGRTAEDALRSLLNNGLIRLVWFNHKTNEEEPILSSDTEKLLADRSVWEPPRSGVRYVAYTATPAGESVWRSSKPPTRAAT
jgi:hypothetical protein